MIKKLETIGDYPGEKIKFDRAFLKKCMKIRKLQTKYGLAGKSDLPIFMTACKRPIFKFSDLLALFNIMKANRNVHEFLEDFDLLAEPADYQVPIYYILGENDWQAPYSIAKEYFNTINAPHSVYGCIIAYL